MEEMTEETNISHLKTAISSDHNYTVIATKDRQEDKKNKSKRSGPSCMEKNQQDFEQLRNSKLIKIDIFTERCMLCGEHFSTSTEADMHVRRQSCDKNTQNKKT